MTVPRGQSNYDARRKSGDVPDFRRRLLLRVGLVLASGWLWSSAAQAACPTDVRAAFLYHVTRFVEWPADSTANEDDTVRVAVLGSEDLVHAVTVMLHGKTIAGRRPVVVEPTRLEQLRHCHVV